MARAGQDAGRAGAGAVPQLSAAIAVARLRAAQRAAGFQACAKVKAGDRITVEIHPTEQSQAFKPEAMALDVVQ